MSFFQELKRRNVIRVGIAYVLGVSNILEGSVRKAGDQVRITAQLIRANDGFHLWSEAYDRKLENIFAIQDDIAGKIAAALQVSLGISNTQPAQPVRLVNPEVYDLYLRARTLHRQRGPGVVKAIELFEQALAIDPEFAPAWAGLSHSYIVVINYVSEAEQESLGDVGAKSMAAAQKALSQANHAAGEFGLRDENIRAALEISPGMGNLQTYNLMGILQSGNFEEARRYAEQLNDETARVDEMLHLIDWLADPEKEPDETAAKALQTLSSAALLVDRYDLWLASVEADGAVWSEWELSATVDLLAPIVSPELTAKYRADPRSKALLEKLRLPEYWREVGWPEQCRPLSGDDFVCE